MIKTYVSRILNELKFQDWNFRVSDVFYSAEGEYVFIQVEFYAPDVSTGEHRFHLGRVWVIEPHMNESDIIRTAYKAIHCAMDHEIDEHITYKGRRIFDPHKGVDING